MRSTNVKPKSGLRKSSSSLTLVTPHTQLHECSDSRLEPSPESYIVWARMTLPPVSRNSPDKTRRRRTRALSAVAPAPE